MGLKPRHLPLFSGLLPPKFVILDKRWEKQKCVCLAGAGEGIAITGLENQGPPHLHSLERAEDVKVGS